MHWGGKVYTAGDRCTLMGDRCTLRGMVYTAGDRCSLTGDMCTLREIGINSSLKVFYVFVLMVNNLWS